MARGAAGATVALTLAAAALLFGCAPSRSQSVVPPVSAAPDVSGARALEETASFLAISPRVSGSPQARLAAEYLRDRLTTLGLPAIIDSFSDAAPGGPIVFQNVLSALPAAAAATEVEDDASDAPALLKRAVRPGGGAVILISHYDTKEGMGPDFQGANDSGSSTGLLLELARAFRETGYDRPLLFAFVDGEECKVRYGPTDGLHGSRRLARQLVELGLAAHTRAVIVLDMVGDRDLTLTIPRNCDRELMRLLFSVADREGLRRHVSLARSAIIDDHVPFLEIGVPAINLIDFEYGSRPGMNDYWHTAEDTLDKLDAQSLEVVGRLTVGLILDLQRHARTSAP